MRRRIWLGGAAALAGCSVLPKEPYVEKRDWPLAVRRPAVLPARHGGPVLLVRTIQAAPGLESRGLQWLLPDGSLHIDYYEQWAVPPAQAVEDSLRQWLSDAGLFAAVVGPGSRLTADLVLEGELSTFVGDPGAGVARAGRCAAGRRAAGGGGAGACRGVGGSSAAGGNGCGGRGLRLPLPLREGVGGRGRSEFA